MVADHCWLVVLRRTEADALAERVGSITVLNIGGGLGVPSHPGEPSLDIDALAQVLAQVRASYPQFSVWMEPGRYLVADAGVLLARVNQDKNGRYVRAIREPVGVSSDIFYLAGELKPLAT